MAVLSITVTNESSQAPPNYGNWHIDHIQPIASFDFNSPEDEGLKSCWALDNLQPLWAKDNWVKKNS